jgi:hypothetical protein
LGGRKRRESVVCSAVLGGVGCVVVVVRRHGCGCGWREGATRGGRRCAVKLAIWGGGLLYAGVGMGEGAGEMWRRRAWAESVVWRCTSGMEAVVVQEVAR